MKMHKLRSFLIVCLFLGIEQMGFAQKPIKKDLYLYFTPDSPNYKYTRSQNPVTLHGIPYPDAADIYSTKYLSEDGTYWIRNSYFVTINKNRYRVTDSLEFKALKPVPYQNLPNIKDVGIDTSDKLNFPFRNVYVIEKLSPNQFKVVQVSTYIGSDKVLYSPGKNL